MWQCPFRPVDMIELVLKHPRHLITTPPSSIATPPRPPPPPAPTPTPIAAATPYTHHRLPSTIPTRAHQDLCRHAGDRCPRCGDCDVHPYSASLPRYSPNGGLARVARVGSDKHPTGELSFSIGTGGFSSSNPTTPLHSLDACSLDARGRYSARVRRRDTRRRMEVETEWFEREVVEVRLGLGAVDGADEVGREDRAHLECLDRREKERMVALLNCRMSSVMTGNESRREPDSLAGPKGGCAQAPRRVSPERATQTRLLCRRHAERSPPSLPSGGRRSPSRHVYAQKSDGSGEAK